MGRTVTPKPIVVPDTPLPLEPTPRGFGALKWDAHPERWQRYVAHWHPGAAEEVAMGAREQNVMAALVTNPARTDQAIAQQQRVKVELVTAVRRELVAAGRLAAPEGATDVRD